MLDAINDYGIINNILSATKVTTSILIMGRVHVGYTLLVS